MNGEGIRCQSTIVCMIVMYLRSTYIQSYCSNIIIDLLEQETQCTAKFHICTLYLYSYESLHGKQYIYTLYTLCIYIITPPNFKVCVR